MTCSSPSRQGAPTVEGRPGASMAPYDFEKSRERLTKMFPNYTVRDVDVLSHAMYPKVRSNIAIVLLCWTFQRLAAKLLQVFEEYVAFIESFGKLQALPTHTYFAGMNIGETIHVDLDKGNTVHVTYLARGNVDSAGFTELFFEVNGQPRSLYVRDKNAAKTMGLKV